MTSNFSFLDETFPVLGNFGELAEKYLYSDSNSCLIKLGMIGETIVNLMFTYDDIPLPTDNITVNKINTLQKEGLLTGDQATILHGLRKIRNKAAHENYSSVEDGKTFLQLAYSLCEWFMQTYGDWNYEHKDFVMPEENPDTVAPDEDKEKLIEEKLSAQAQEKATAAPAISRADRKNKASKAENQRPRTEAETRFLIDEQLRMVGWEADTENIRYSKGTRPKKGHNIAIAEYPTDSKVGDRGYADYALFIGEKLVGIIEAKAIHKDIPSVLDYQGKDYPSCIRKEDEKYLVGTWGEYKVPFTFATNGRPYLEQYRQKSGIWFLDLRKPENVPRALRGWVSPEGIEKWLEEDIAAAENNLSEMSYDLLTDKDGLNLRPYQVKAIQATEKAIASGQKAILLAMATGTGKTRTILGMIYRFLVTGRFRRVLFLVDRTELGRQAQDVFKEVKIEDLLTINDIYDIKEIDETEIDRETRISVSTVQGMVKRILYHSGDAMPAVSDYDLVVVDEAHRGYILNREMTDEEILFRDQRDYQSKYRSVVEYFDAVKVALTATPALHTTQIFGQPVFTYTYREAVIEGYLVDHDAPHALKTRLSTEGIHYKSGDTVTIYDPSTGELTNGELLEDELDFNIDNFNRQVITEEFNRVVLTEIARDLDPEHPGDSGKTLIYAVDDAHADMIVSILKEIYAGYGVNTDAIMKITGSVAGGNKKKIHEAVLRFKNEDYPSVAVTVDLLTTGIDVPSITTLVFMRRVKSRILFEQMMGRATRPCPEIHKTHFEIYDPVGVYDSLEAVNTMKPVSANPKISYTDLLDGLRDMDDEEQIKYQITQIMAKLQRSKSSMDDKTMTQFVAMSGGLTPAEFMSQLDLTNPRDASETLNSYYDLFVMLQDSSHGKPGSVVISDKEDELISHTRGYGKSDSGPQDYIDEFSAYVKSHINEIGALEIICTRPKDLTRDSLRSLMLTLDREGYTQRQLNTAISQLTNEDMAADIISLVRRYAIGSPLVSHEARIRSAVDKLRKAHDFTKLELNWIRRIEDYLLNESVLNVGVFDEDSRFKSQGGFARIDKVFGNKLESIVLELNEYLYDDGGKAA
ncbi:MAG: type I restriction-modification system endonuclease [Clostridiales bacterium]|nr:type I restriction-modification system endonuclease [Clostridiales bacterium]